MEKVGLFLKYNSYGNYKNLRVLFYLELKYDASPTETTLCHPRLS